MSNAVMNPDELEAVFGGCIGKGGTCRDSLSCCWPLKCIDAERRRRVGRKYARRVCSDRERLLQ